MVRGETYDKQLFESEAFRHFINIFLNKQNGITKGCELAQETNYITVKAGNFVIQGGFLKEATGTKNEIPSEAGYYKLVYEIDLSKTNTKDSFNQGSYKFVKSLGEYPKLTQDDLENGGTVFQMPFCQFRITETGLQDFKDLRVFLNFDGIYKEVKEKIEAIEDGSLFLTKEEKQGNVLFENAAGTNSSINLAENISNYKYIEIEYIDNAYKTSNSIKIPAKTGSVDLNSTFVSGNSRTVIIAGKRIKIQENKATIEDYGVLNTWNNSFIKEDRILITKVTGFKF